MSSNVLRNLIQVTYIYHISQKSILILPSYLALLNFPTKLSFDFIISSQGTTCQPVPIRLDFLHVITFDSLINADQLG
jgi:hypothetical protein